MSEERLPFLRGRITLVDTFKGPRTPRGKKPKLPSLDPRAHRDWLLQRLDAIQAGVNARSETARDALASREIVAVHPGAEAVLVPEQLDDARNAWLVGVVPETGTVLLDAADADMEYLRKKVDAFADDSKVKAKTHRDGTPKVDENGVQIVARQSENAVAPIGDIALASLDDIRGPRMFAEDFADDRAYWFEIACRGGYRRPPADTDRSRTQVARQLKRLGAEQKVQEFVGPEKVYFFVRCTRKQLEELLAATDCVYEADLAPPRLRDLRLLEDVTTKDIESFLLQPPPQNAPAVVILDTGIATRHPLLQAAILSATTAGPEIPSPEDTYGHGTKMAGLSLYRDLGSAVARGEFVAPHWLQSSRLLVAPGLGTASDENYEVWPVLTLGAVRSAEEADSLPRDRVFAMAVTRSMQEPPLEGLEPTLWSHAIDQIAFHDGNGRLMIVSAGNARYDQWLVLAEQYPELQLSEKIHQPAQAKNALTVGAYTDRVGLPPSPDYSNAHIVAQQTGGISPFTSTGLTGNEWSIKPDIVLEGGNLAIAGSLPDDSVPTLCALTTSHLHTTGRPLGLIAKTSEATARAANLAARVWAVEPRLWPETVRGLLVHSATWTDTMKEQFPGLDDRLQAFGYGVPVERIASECAQSRATVIVEESMPNAVEEHEPKKTAPKRATTKTTEPKDRRKIKIYRVPIPDELLTGDDPDVELRVTLSYFAEPNKFRRTVLRGLDLKWDMQGPHEREDVFLERINVLRRPIGPDGRRQKPDESKSFAWDVGIQRRSRGTVQSDRWRGKMSELVGDKLIAVVPVLGWWDQRRPLRHQEMRFSLIVSVFGPGVYAAIKPRVEASIPMPIQV